MTVTISLLASLVVAVTVIPMLSALGARLGPLGSPGRDEVRATGAPVDTGGDVAATGGPAFTLGWFSHGYAMPLFFFVCC